MGDIIIENYYVMMLYIIAMGLLAWEVISLLRFKKLIIRGSMPAQKVTFPILAVVFCFIIIKNFGMNSATVVLCVIYLIGFVLAMLLACGITDKGIVSQGVLSKYQRVRYYNFDVLTGAKPRLRYGIGFQEKFIVVEEKDIELCKAYFYKYNVPNFEEYVELKKEAKRKQLEDSRK